MKFKKTLSAWLSTRYQLVVRNEEDLAEKSTFRFSYAKLLSLSTILLLVFIALSLALSTTILARWLNPAYAEQENKKKLIQLATEVDVLEQQTSQQKKFIALLQNIIAGKEPPADEPAQAEEKQDAPSIVPYTAEQMANADAQLRNEFEGSEAGSWTAYNNSLDDLQALFFFPPVNGTITKPFKKELGHYGIEIAVSRNQPIKCAADGVVVFSSWTVETGWVIVVQHNSNLVSIYKHNASLLKKVGSFVRAGDVIATLDNSSKLSTIPHLNFELWYEGNPINPEHFIAF